jgi:MraZ protein
MFLSTYTNKIDKKGRVSVPAPFRATLQHQVFQGIVALRSHKFAAIDAFGWDRMERLSQTMDTFDLFSDVGDDLSAALFAEAQQLPFDGEGRIVIPELLLDHGTITDTVTFVGRGPTFQIWNPEAFQDYQKEARLRIKTQPDLFKIKLNSRED